MPLLTLLPAMGRENEAERAPPTRAGPYGLFVAWPPGWCGSAFSDGSSMLLLQFVHGGGPTRYRSGRRSIAVGVAWHAPFNRGERPDNGRTPGPCLALNGLGAPGRPASGQPTRRGAAWAATAI